MNPLPGDAILLTPNETERFASLYARLKQSEAVSQALAETINLLAHTIAERAGEPNPDGFGLDIEFRALIPK